MNISHCRIRVTAQNIIVSQRPRLGLFKLFEPVLWTGFRRGGVQTS